MKKNTFVQYKKVTLIYFPFTILKKSIREKKKIQRGKKN
jgi:hypothetical protein